MSSRTRLFKKKEDFYKISYISEENTRYEVFHEYICRFRFTFRIVTLSKYFLSSYSLEHLVLSASGVKRLGLVFWKLCRKVIKSFNKAIFLWGICFSNVLFCNLERILLFFFRMLIVVHAQWWIVSSLFKMIVLWNTWFPRRFSYKKAIVYLFIFIKIKARNRIVIKNPC